jgi:hypothetical protein
MVQVVKSSDLAPRHPRDFAAALPSQDQETDDRCKGRAACAGSPPGEWPGILRDLLTRR